MEYTFYRNSSGSFLVFQEAETDNSYIRKMLQTGEIPFLLEENAVRLGNTVELHYRIGGMQTLEKRFEKKKMSAEDITQLLGRLVRVREACASHLLPDSHLLVLPELIFVSYLRNDYCFVYLPEQTQSFVSQLQLLADFLIKHVSYDRADDAGVELVYALHDAARLDSFELTDWWEENRPSDIADTMKPQVHKEESTADAKTDSEGRREKFSGAQEDPAQLSAFRDPDVPEQNPASGSLEIVSLTEDWDLKWPQDPLAGQYTGGGLIPFLRHIIHKDDKKARKARRQSKKEPKRKTAAEAERQKDAAAPLLHPQTVPVIPQEDGTVCLADFRNTAAAPDETASQPPHALIPMDGGQEIRLEKPYLLVGTAAKNVDIVLTDHTISRIHAEIFTDADGVRIEDCNSSNGTIVDGQLLGPNEQKELKTGMHIRLGRTEFVFR